MISIRKCTCCGREFVTGVFGSRCLRCQDSGHWTNKGFVGTRHKPCRKDSHSDFIQLPQDEKDDAVKV